ncbi:hypothetical protein JCM10908_007250 [Rhodotorula pacifica]|uniref:uncharacterized protein n=1 Tax=Rhodotorula pacifica TaxID=1495444 RepID=UPI003181DE30
MATVATQPVSATSSPSQQPGGAAHGQKQSRSRMLRSIGRFLSGGGTKQRPKLQNAESPRADATHPERAIEGTSSPPTRKGDRRRRRRSSSPRSSRAGSETEEERDGEGRRCEEDDGDDDGQSAGGELSTQAVRRFPRNDSVSRYSAVSGADTEASLYAMASTRPGSSLHTVDSSSHASSVAPSGHASTHKSYASTKPTTLLSVDSLGGANRIAVVPGTGASNYHAPGAGGGNTSTALSFSSVLPSTPPQSSPLANAVAGPSGENSNRRHQRGTSASSSSSFNSYDLPATDAGIAFSIAPDSPSSATSGGDRRHDGVNVPSYSHPHPRNNPHPAYPAQDNASILTLASSSFAPSFIGSTGGESKTRTNSWGGGGLGGLHAWSSKQQARSLGGGARSLVTPDGLGAGVAADEDASVRALPGSRRASEESLGSRSTWSAAPKGATPSVRSRPLDDELAASAANSGSAVAGRAASTSPSKKERRTSLRTVETAPSVRSNTTADAQPDVDSSSVLLDEVTATDEEGGGGQGGGGTEAESAAADTTVRSGTGFLAPQHRTDSNFTTAASVAESYVTAPEAGGEASSRDDLTSTASTPLDTPAGPPAEATELAPPIPAADDVLGPHTGHAAQ